MDTERKRKVFADAFGRALIQERRVKIFTDAGGTFRVFLTDLRYIHEGGVGRDGRLEGIERAIDAGLAAVVALEIETSSAEPPQEP